MDSEHPIPQEVSTYQFKLVGDMTIQQFMQVAGGALISLVIYSSNLAGYVKWPLILISFLTGVAFAFFPLEERPLSKWLVLFLKAIYSPTVYVWNKNAVKHDFFQPENTTVYGDSTPQTTTPSPTQVVQVAAATTAPDATQLSQSELVNLEKKEQEFLTKVSQQFVGPGIQGQQQVNSSPAQQLKAAVTQTNKAATAQVAIPQSSPVTPERNMNNETPSATDIFSSKSMVGSNITPVAEHTLSDAQTAVFSSDASPPSPPTRPNVIVGQTLDTDGKIIDAAILEIKDSSGRSVRALRTNRLGHFMIVTPLNDGQYQITTEKDGYTFEPISIKMEGRVIPPVAIKGRKQANPAL